MMLVRCLAVLASGVLASTASAALIIDHHAIDGVPNLPQSTMNAIASQFNFYFAHASVGENTMGGIASLNAGNGGFYELTRQQITDTPPATTGRGFVYDYNRGNPGYVAKTDGFAAALANGWGTKAKVLINKYCWTDAWDADWQYYAVANANHTALAQLEPLYPNATFVYVTMPLFVETTGTLSDDLNANAFNANLRAWCIANNKILWDLADIEAYDPNGNHATFTYNGQTYEQMYNGYAANPVDNLGHLNTLGSEREAMAFYALGASLVPEPSTLGLLALGAVALLRRPSRHVAA